MLLFLRDGTEADAGNVIPVVGEVLRHNESGSCSDIVCHAVRMVI